MFGRRRGGRGGDGYAAHEAVPFGPAAVLEDCCESDVGRSGDVQGGNDAEGAAGAVGGRCDGLEGDGAGGLAGYGWIAGSEGLGLIGHCSFWNLKLNCWAEGIRIKNLRLLVLMFVVVFAKERCTVAGGRSAGIALITWTYSVVAATNVLHLL